MDQSNTHTTKRADRLLLVGSVLVGVGVAGLLLITSSGLPMVWDEGNAIGRAEGVTRWVGRWLPGGSGDNLPGPLSQEAIASDWRYTTQIEGHPALCGIVIATGRAVSSWCLGPLDSARAGPILLFGLAAGAFFYRMWRYSAAAAVGATVALVLLPRLFAHAHFAGSDGLVTSCWMLSWAAFAPARIKRRWAVVWGIALGMTLAAKASGWFAPLPFLVWAAVYRDRAAGRALAIGLPVAALTFFLLNPPLWHHPLIGTAAFFQLNSDRAAQPGLNISTQFLGQMYNLDYPLPWYNTLVWTAVTVPLPLLVLAVVGLVAVLGNPRQNKAGMLLVMNWLVLLIVRALPGVPPHDGVRLFLPAFAFLAALVGVGTARSLVAMQRGGPRLRRTSVACLVAVFLASATSLFWYAPQWLSYYNLAIGGQRGATALGMEPTYYWDGLDRSVLNWLNRHTDSDAAAPVARRRSYIEIFDERPAPESSGRQKVRFGAGPVENLAMMRRWGWFKPDTRLDSPGTFRWYVMQYRPSGWSRADHWLLKNATPVLRKTIRPDGLGPWRLDVPLVEVYSYQQYQRARAATGQ